MTDVTGTAGSSRIPESRLSCHAAIRLFQSRSVVIRFPSLLMLVAAISLATRAEAQRHPSIFITKAEAIQIRDGAAHYPLLSKSLNNAMATFAAGISHPMDVPQPG